MGDGAMCHYCRRYNCVCTDSTAQASSQACPCCGGTREQCEANEYCLHKWSAVSKDAGTEETLEQLCNVSHEDLDDAYVGPCPKCGGKQVYDRSVPRSEGRPLRCLNGKCDYGRPSDQEYVARAEQFLANAAKMNNAPVVWMVAAAFKNEDRAWRAEAALRETHRIKCIYCGWKTEPVVEDNDRWEDMRRHIETCEKRFSTRGYEMYKSAVSRAEKAEAERDQALEVIREYQRSAKSHVNCGNGKELCSICIKADVLLSKEKER